MHRDIYFIIDAATRSDIFFIDVIVIDAKFSRMYMYMFSIVKKTPLISQVENQRSWRFLHHQKIKRTVE